MKKYVQLCKKLVKNKVQERKRIAFSASLWYTSDRKAKVYRNTRKGRGEIVMMRHRLQHWEQQALLWFQEHLRRSWLTAAMKIATFLGNGGILWLTACACLLVRQQTRRAALTALLSLVFSALVCNALLKNLVERARPFDKIPGLQFLIRKPHDFSFPSGHTSSSFAVATVFLATLPLWFGLTALGIAAVIAFSRMYLGVHYPSDVLCGMVLGILFGLAALIVLPLLLEIPWLPEAVRAWVGTGAISANL